MERFTKLLPIEIHMPPSIQTVDRSGLFEKAWRRLLRKMDSLGEIDWSECMGDGTVFVR